MAMGFAMKEARFLPECPAVSHVMLMVLFLISLGVAAGDIQGVVLISGDFEYTSNTHCASRTRALSRR